MLLAPGKVKLKNGASSCIIWTRESQELDGQYAYLMFDADKNVTSAGIHGSTLQAPEANITLQQIGSMTASVNAAGTYALKSVQPGENQITTFNVSPPN